MLKTIKRGVLQACGGAGVFTLAGNSQWRRERLLILCYHGISFADEHQWSPALYMTAETFRDRMKILRDERYEVLPLGEGLERLEQGTLPAKSVVITIDDGNYNFHALAYPVLKDFGFPATVYLSTYYCHRQLPVFDVTVSYLLWKGRGKTMDLSGLLGGAGQVVLDETAAKSTFREVYRWVRERGLSAEQKDELARELARRLDLDYGWIERQRVFHLMTAEETAEVSRNGFAVELHTHRHRTPRDRALFGREIEDNRMAIQAITGVAPRHFCYPSGDFAPEYFSWLRADGVASATTCEFGFAGRGDDPMRLPRLLDMTSFSSAEFEGWLSGVSAFLPHR